MHPTDEQELEHFERVARLLSAHQVQVLRILAAVGPADADEVAAAWPREWLARSPALAPRLPRLLLRTLWQLEGLGYVRDDEAGRYRLSDDGATRLQRLAAP